MNRLLFWLLAVGYSMLFACRHGSKTEQSYQPPALPLFTQLPAAHTGITFVNEVTNTQEFNILTYRNFYNGGGVAIGDINNDGLSDVYLVSNMGKSHLYLNKGNWKFEDITEKAGVAGRNVWATGVTMADVNADGLLDIYLCHSGDVQGQNRENELFINRGNGTFAEQATQYGLNDKGFSTHASFFDYDLDGDLDCYVLNNSFKDASKFNFTTDSREIRDPLGGDKLYQNVEGKYVDVSEKAHIYGSKIGFGLGISVGDVNGDMWPDLYISNDFYEKDYLYINQKNGTFREETNDRLGHTSLYSMGSDMADINNDGWKDVLTSDMLPDDNHRLKTMIKFDEFSVLGMKSDLFHFQYIQNGLQINNGNGIFSEASYLSGVAATDWSWGALIFDFENDGWKDLFVSNGIYNDITNMDFVDFLSDKEKVKTIVKEKQRFDFRDFLPYVSSTPLPNYAFVNKKNLTFASNAYELGLGKPSFSNGAAYGDLDNDGDLDLVVNNVNMESFVYRNEANTQTTNNYLKIAFKGSDKNPFGVGAEVRIFSSSGQQVFHQMPSRGFQSCVEPVLTMGVGKSKIIDSLVVIWPDLRMQILSSVKAGQLLTLDYAQAKQKYSTPIVQNSIFLEDKTSALIKGDVTHHENLYVDFDQERLMPHMLSTLGPKIATGDVNGDGLEDFFIGGAKGEGGKLFIQDKTGHFSQLPQKDIEEDKSFEDTGLAFLDADGDKDLDLLIASGGNQINVDPVAYAVRLYLNDGKGMFTGDPERSPKILVNASCVTVCDFDQDGDDDVFIGSRSGPGQYGLSPKSYLLRNTRQGFDDVTPQSLSQIGMVSDATWADYNKDGLKDLVVVGEWMPVMVFKNSGTQLQPIAEVPQSNGWWNSIKSADLDNDGDPDFVLGNWGTNSRLQATVDQPMHLYAKDFDQNGTIDPLITHYSSKGASVLFASKGDLNAQIPSLKKKILKYEEYANSTYRSLFNESERYNAIEKVVYTLQTSVLINEGGGKFILKPLSVEAQIAPVFGILIQDLNQDGHSDILLGGNFYGLKPELGRQDGSYGTFLLGNGKGDFVSAAQQTVLLKGEVRDIASVAGVGSAYTILVARNNQSFLVLRPKSPPL